MPFCPKCGNENPQGVVYCNSCGSPLSVPTTRVEITHRYERAQTYKVVHVRHAYCDGNGIDYRPSPMGVKCNGCDGTGQVSLKVESTSSLVECPCCEGTGVDHKVSLIGVECKSCHGIGLVPQRVYTL